MISLREPALPARSANRPALWLTLLLIALSVAQPAVARQLSFAAEQRLSAVEFRYQFDTGQPPERHLAFSLPLDTINAGFSGYAAFDRDRLIEQLRSAVGRYVLRWRGELSVRIDPSGNGYQMQMVATAGLPIKTIEADLDRVTRQTSDEYLHQYFLRLDGNTVMPDYGRIARYYAEVLRPVGRALLQAAGPEGARPAAERERVALALAFIQGIPYDEVTPDRTRFAFVTPPALLIRNRGDCDTKSVALASLLATLTPGIPAAVVLVPGHALLGVGLPPRPGDRTLRVGMRDFVLLEPVGPALLPLGRISEHSSSSLAAGKGVLVLPVDP